VRTAQIEGSSEPAAGQVTAMTIGQGLAC
jgi:hypothetical protein